MDNKLMNDILYILHTYYPQNRDNLTDLDWQLYTGLTNCLMSGGKVNPIYNESLRLKAKEIVDESIFSFPAFEEKIEKRWWGEV